MSGSGKFFWRFFAGLAIALSVTACQSSGPTPDQMSRSTADTAPADLQLLCATSVAQSTGVDSAKVLPTGSRKLDAQSYQVELSVEGRPMSCTVSSEGQVLSTTAS